MIDFEKGICIPDEFPSHAPLIPVIVERYADIDTKQILHSPQYSNIEIGCTYYFKRPLTIVDRVLCTSIEFRLTQTILHCVTDECYSCIHMITNRFEISNPYHFNNGYIYTDDKQRCMVCLSHTTQFHLIKPYWSALNAEAQQYFSDNANEVPLECQECKPRELLGLFSVSDVQNNRIPDCVGCYALYNTNQDKWYVGQARSVTKRLKQHFGGIGGNGDVYADFKYGDVFEVFIYPLCLSSFNTLTEQERHYIKYFQAYENGYNRMR